MPVRAHGQAIHDLPTICLYGVQVLHRHVKQGAAQAIVDLRDERLLVLPLLEAGHHVGFVGEDRRDEARDVLRLELHVRRVEDEHVGARVEVSGAQCVSNAAARAMPHGAQKRVLRPELLEHGPRAVGRAVVDDDHLVPSRRGGERFRRLFHEQRQVLRFVHRGNEDGNGGLRMADGGWRSGAEGHEIVHTRLRMRAERTPSWSRYFATVRRAIWTPDSLRMFTIAWSVNGCLGSSSATSFSICALMPRAETSSPAVVDNPDEKKNLSGSTPRGVCTNFSFVTRLTVDSCMLITSATSRRVRGLRCCTPFSKNSRCRSTM